MSTAIDVYLSDFGCHKFPAGVEALLNSGATRLTRAGNFDRRFASFKRMRAWEDEAVKAVGAAYMAGADMNSFELPDLHA